MLQSLHDYTPQETAGHRTRSVAHTDESRQGKRKQAGGGRLLDRSKAPVKKKLHRRQPDPRGSEPITEVIPASPLGPRIY